MRVLVTGSRDWDNREQVYSDLNAIVDQKQLFLPPDEHGNTMPDPSKITVVHGDCPTGADHWADQWCISNFLEAETHPAEWDKYGRRAGFKRNAEMVRLGADLCLAFIKNNSKGATHTANLARRYQIPVITRRA